LRHLRVSGGLSRIAPLCQKLANLSGLPVTRSQQQEASARGIAWLAAGRPADWARTDDVQLFAPQPDSALAGRYGKFVEHLLRRIEAGNYD
jgi:glycerol kinase